MTKLIVTAGMPGSGKSTWIRRFLSYPIVSSDGIRIELFGSLVFANEGDRAERAAKNARVFEIFDQRIEAIMTLTNGSVVADSTALHPQSRVGLIHLARSLGAEPHLFVFENKAQARSRNLARDEDEIVPEEVMNRMEIQFDKMIGRELASEDWESITYLNSV